MTLNITVLCQYAECRILFSILLNIIMLNVVMLSVIMLSVIAPLINDPDIKGLNPDTAVHQGPVLYKLLWP
jgi:hypothetical protein